MVEFIVILFVAVALILGAHSLVSHYERKRQDKLDAEFKKKMAEEYRQRKREQVTPSKSTYASPTPVYAPRRILTASEINAIKRQESVKTNKPSKPVEKKSTSSSDNFSDGIIGGIVGGMIGSSFGGGSDNSSPPPSFDGGGGDTGGGGSSDSF